MATKPSLHGFNENKIFKVKKDYYSLITSLALLDNKEGSSSSLLLISTIFPVIQAKIEYDEPSSHSIEHKIDSFSTF